MYYVNKHYENRTIHIEKCGFVIYDHCTFENCHFIIKNPSELVLTGNRYYNCTFDVDLSDTVEVHFGDVEIETILNLNNSTYNIFNKTVGTPVPPEGKAITGYKILHSADNSRWAIVKLRIPEDAHRSCAGVQDKRKCRASSAYVEAIYEIKGIRINCTTHGIDAISMCPVLLSSEMKLVPIIEFYNSCFNSDGWDTNYVVGKEMKADEWDYNRFAECTHGIHFFLNLRTAITEMMYFVGDLQRDKILVEFSRKEKEE